MSSLVCIPRSDPLTADRFASVVTELKTLLRDRVSAAYIFGSAGTDEMTIDSDIDLLLVVSGCEKIPFVERGLEFRDLFDTFPAIDLLVYSPAELTHHLADADVGFWKSVRGSMRRIV